MIIDIDEFEEAKEKKRLIYRAPLPKKKQRTFTRGRSGKVRVFTRDEITEYMKGVQYATFTVAD